ncbi:MAG: hypothetical protein Q9174_000435 [Haloplaca sp. 1 TL-2023]
MNQPMTNLALHPMPLGHGFELGVECPEHVPEHSSIVCDLRETGLEKHMLLSLLPAKMHWMASVDFLVRSLNDGEEFHGQSLLNPINCHVKTAQSIKSFQYDVYVAETVFWKFG